ncbi:MAG TPA: DNA polymerase III subunit gamma/tau, partial [Polyangiaceae bacterium]|nr:DNA polymerase III subunit gamma/tau [Polyangiaceae bacterium]
MSYLVLARKWRPMTFDDLVGQEHVSRTLSNAIVSGRIAHAFLFTGVRGVGKTTSARILAKSLNCEAGPTPKPCLQCPACTEIAASNDIDVQEIDGASYNGVDEVRRLQESLPYRPSRDRFKVVIVDEVHMLSSNAWNAFLKTLEEPPPHVKFIFATTEVHKVPVTILSRCQRYDFKLISSSSIAKQLRHVLDQEGIAADDAALGLMAREAAGSMRDAMSLLDQAIAWGGDKLVGEEIARVLGIAGRGKLLELAQAMVHGDAQAVLMIVAHLADQGFDLVQVARDTLEVLRDLVVVKVCNSPDSLTDLTPEELATMRALVADARGEDLIRLHHGFSTGFDQVVHAPQQRSALEMLLLRLVFRPPLLPVDDLISRLDGIERRLVGRGAALPRSGGPVALRNHRGATAFEPTERTESVSAGDRAVMAARAQPSAAVKDP